MRKLMMNLFKAYGNSDKERYEIYVSFFKDTPADILAGAITECLKESRFLPTIHELYEKTKPKRSVKMQAMLDKEA